MKVTLNWLKQYVDFDWSSEETVERLTMLGLEVEGVQKIAGAFEGIVVAQILTRDPVPGANKLSVCKVNDGNGERTIICGAQNHKPGDKVPLILPNFALPPRPGDKEPFVIKERKVFGITSQGMMCSPQELGLPDKVEGLLILREDAKIGQSFAEYLGLNNAGKGDVVFDLEVTPNRPDLNSVIGIAREIAAVTGNKLKMPDVNLVGPRCSAAPSSKDAQQRVPANDLVNVRIEDAELCPRYVARVVKGVKIGPSPGWLRSTLEKVGIRSINNVVDVTNYVMLEMGEPLHAFDYHLVGQASRLSQTSDEKDGDRQDACPTVIVRRAKEGEKFKTLDGVERTLTSEMLLIADEQKGIALAGVMGGANTEINDQTVDVLIESAYFSPTNIRRTSKALGLRSESSYRFERGADIGSCDCASRRAVQLIVETAGGQVAEGAVDAYPKPFEPRQITLRHHKVNELLGITLRPEEMEFYLGQLGLKVLNRKARPVGQDASPEPITFQIPTWRVDLKRETDLIEEIERLHGLDKIPATPPRGAIGANPFDSIYDQISEAKRILTGLGLDEAQSQTLVDDVSSGGTRPATELVKLSNPMNSEMNTLRPSLLVGLIDSIAHNHAHNNPSAALFEIGTTFRQEAKIIEQRSLAIALTGMRNPVFWAGEERNAKYNSYDLKGIVEEFLEQFGIKGVVYKQPAAPDELYLECAEASLGGKLFLGRLGQVHPRHFASLKLRDHVYVAEFNFEQLLARRNPVKSYKPTPQFPAIRRDVAMLVPEATTHEAVLRTVKQAKPANLEGVELFDVFRGKNVPEGQKSMAYAFIYRSPEKTLTDSEVNTAQAAIVEAFKSQLKAVVRE
jgi:phenylalanyl-tRNA synthetase beta chain